MTKSFRAPGWRGIILQREERQLARRREIALTVLVMDGERLDRKLPKLHHRRCSAMHRPFRQFDDLTPRNRGVTEPPVSSIPQAQSVQRLAPDLGAR